MNPKKRLSKTDWALVAEAMQMLSLDYEGEHPSQERLEAILDMATMRADFETLKRIEQRTKA